MLLFSHRVVDALCSCRLDFLKEELAKERNKNEDLSKSLSKVKVTCATVQSRSFPFHVTCTAMLEDSSRSAFIMQI